MLAASAPGRGRPDLELVGVDEPRRFGPPAVDPAELPDDELLRVATGLLAEDLVRVATVPNPSAIAPNPHRPRTRYELAGDPWLAAALTAQLVADGRPPGGGGRSVHVLGTDLADDARPHLGRRGVRHRAPRAGRTSWPGCGPGGGCPAGSTCPASSSGSAPGRTPAGSGWCSTSARCPRLVGVRRLEPVPDAPAHATELARQVGAALSLHVLPAEQAALLSLGAAAAARRGRRRAARRARRSTADWVEDAAFALRQRLLRARYPVVGDPDGLLPQLVGAPARLGPRPRDRAAAGGGAR